MTKKNHFASYFSLAIDNFSPINCCNIETLSDNFISIVINLVPPDPICLSGILTFKVARPANVQKLHFFSIITSRYYETFLVLKKAIV